MPIRNTLASILAVCLMAAALPACGKSNPQAAGNGKLSPEEQAMMMRDARDKLMSMPQDQRRAYRQQLKQQWASMTSDQQTQKRAQLDSEWQGLPQAQKDKVEARIQQHEAKQNGGGGASTGDGGEGGAQ